MQASVKVNADVEINVEVPLHPKAALVSHPKALRPIALLPVLRNLLGSIVLSETGNLLEDTGLWQSAYKKRYQVIDLVLMINLISQNASTKLVTNICLRHC